MKFKSIFTKVAILLCILGVFSVVPHLWHRNSPGGKGSSGIGMSLVRPAFAQETGMNFLEQEAGIAAYMNAGQRIDLSKAKGAFRTVERETSEYAVGSVPLTGYPETEDVHVYVHKDGWIVAYYLKGEPAAKITDWINYGKGKGMEGTRLDACIFYISGTAEVPMKDVKYYDFRYPSASKIMIIAEAILSAKCCGDFMETFKMRLPGELVFNERSYLFYSGGTGGYESYLFINDKEISKIRGGTGPNLSYGIILPTQLPVDTSHIVKLKTYIGEYSGWSLPLFGFIILIYQDL